MYKIAIINGPNLNLLGDREPSVYGSESLEKLASNLKLFFPDVHLIFEQSNLEGELIGWIQHYALVSSGIVINPGGYAHTSVALLDAIRACQVPVVEVHISNVHARETFRHNLLTAAACKGVISGLGTDGYRLAIDYLMKRLAQEE